VLDTSAILAAFLAEPGAEIVADKAASGLLPAVIYSETLAKLSDRSVPLDAAEQFIASLELAPIAFDDEQAVLAASFRRDTRPLGLSFADRAVLACGYAHTLPVLTGDRRLAEAKVGVKIVMIR
jgi:ribonuclease VapC